MKIAFCIFKVFPYGGLSRDCMQLTKECIARGHAVRVYALWWNGPVRDDIELIEVPVRGFSNPRRYRYFAKWVRNHLKSHPVDLVVGINKLPGLDVYYAGDSCYEEKARTQRRRHYRLLPRYRHFSSFERSVFGADRTVKILTLTEAQKHAFKRYYATQDERFFPLPPGVEQEHVQPSFTNDPRVWLRGEFLLNEDGLVVLFIGSGFLKKGLERLLRAVAAFPEPPGKPIQLFVLGEDKIGRFERLASRLGIAQQVHFLGGRGDVARFIHAADAFVLPAHDEAAGIVILEAISAGLPALVTDVCGYASYVAQARAGIVSVSPFDQSRFNGELVRILTSAEREVWRRNGRQFGQSGELSMRIPTACDLIEKFARDEVSGLTKGRLGLHGRVISS
jgi:UDP-glucose:(heptosyl)LPS alpha-1,3-glucosyltransferase